MRRAWIAAIGLCWLVCAPCQDSWGGERKLLIAVLDQVTWHDLLDERVEAPVLRGLAQKGGVAMMCVRTPRSPGGGYLTIGAGSRASSCWLPGTEVSAEGHAFQAQESLDGLAARQLFSAYTGGSAGENAIVHLGLGALQQQNASVEYPLRMGLLGGELRKAGLRTACVGNADTPRSVHREVVAIGMDEQGLVELGEVSSLLTRRDSSLAYRYTTDTPRLLAAFRRAASVAEVVVLELGETSRAAEYAELMTAAVSQATRLQAIEKADRLLGEVLASVEPEEWAVLVITPSVRDPEPEESFAALSPVIFFVPKGASGLLTSPSTRRPGLVTSTDVAPTVLEYFDVELPREVIGRPMAYRAATGGALARLESDILRQDAVEWVRRKVFRWLPILATAALLLAAILLLLGPHRSEWARVLLRGWLLLLLAAPPAMLLAGLLPLTSHQLLAAIAGCALAIALLGGLVTGWRSGHVLPALVLVALLAYDLVRGQQMLNWSPLSYSAAGGSRFYGIGNEYGGALLGAALVAGSGLLSSREWLASRVGLIWGERVGAAVVLAGLIALVGAPRFGANLGMALACAVGFAVFVLYLWREVPTGRDVVGVILLALGIVGAAVVIDVIARGPEASHIGRWASGLRSQGWEAMGQVLGRKWAMNWLLIRVSPWTNVTVVALGIFGLALAARPSAMAGLWKSRPWLAPALGACVAGAAAACLLNDSGILAAALVLLYAAGSLAYLGLGDVAKSR